MDFLKDFFISVTIFLLIKAVFVGIFNYVNDSTHRYDYKRPPKHARRISKM